MSSLPDSKLYHQKKNVELYWMISERLYLDVVKSISSKNGGLMPDLLLAYPIARVSSAMLCFCYQGFAISWQWLPAVCLTQ